MSAANEEEEKIAYDETLEQAVSAIDARESWPKPRDLVVAYWQARNAKNYEEMSVLWPGSETWNQSLEKQEPVEYVFGEAQPAKSQDYIIVPYASKIHFDEHGEYNLKMVLSKRGSSKKRYYIVSGN